MLNVDYMGKGHYGKVHEVVSCPNWVQICILTAMEVRRLPGICYLVFKMVNSYDEMLFSYD